VRAAEAFLDRWVRPDGQVVDEQGVVRSRTQAYALLLAVAAEDGDTLDRVWAWTRTHLRRPDGLLSSRRPADGVPEHEARHASDGDLLTAWALALATERLERPALRQDAHALAQAVMRSEVGTGSLGRPALAAGPWARGTDRTTVVPGHLAPPATAALVALTGDPRWQDLAAAWFAHLRDTTRDGRRLPPDWAEVEVRDTRPVRGPGEPRVQHGRHAMRASVWASCTALGRALLARTWPLLDDAEAAPSVRALDGRPLDRTPAPLAAVAAGATALSAGEDRVGRALLDRASALAAARPSAYGDAWAALGRVLLTTDLLADCG